MLQLPPDETFYVEVLLFLGFAFLMRRLIWQPLLHALHERSKSTIGAQKEAAAMKEEAAALRKRMESTIEQARIAGHDAEPRGARDRGCAQRIAVTRGSSRGQRRRAHPRAASGAIVKHPLPGSMRRVRDRLSAVAAVGLILLPVIAQAAEGEAGHAAEHHAPSPWGLIYPFINFAIYSFVLWRYAWPAVRDYLSDRRANTLSALEAAKSVRAEAEALKAEYDAKLRNLEVEAARAREEVLATAQVEARNILEQAQKSADRIRKDSRLVADEEVARARRTLQEESAALVARLAGELVTKQIGPNDQARFVKDFVTQTRSAAIAPGGSR